jgi:hypothetical protein
VLGVELVVFVGGVVLCEETADGDHDDGVKQDAASEKKRGDKFLRTEIEKREKRGKDLHNFVCVSC